MSQDRFDYCIVGSTPLARLLAGLLAGTHGRSVLLQEGPHSGHGLSHGLDLSVMPLTRPESWALLGAGIAETLRLVTRIGGRGAYSRIDPILFADHAAGQQALGHIRHMAAAHGVAAEMTPSRFLGEGRQGLLLRDAVMLRRAALEPALEPWLTQAGVVPLAADAPLVIAADGSSRTTHAGADIAIAQTVLADDAAIVSRVPGALWPGLLHRVPVSTILTVPARPLAAPVMYQLDDGIVLRQQPGGGVLASGPGDVAALSERLGAVLDAALLAVHAGQASTTRLATTDGAPAVGRLAGHGADVVAGLGPVGAFLAPALARWLCGAALPAEAAWFGARVVDRPPGASPVAEFGSRP